MYEKDRRAPGLPCPSIVAGVTPSCRWTTTPGLPQAPLLNIDALYPILSLSDNIAQFRTEKLASLIKSSQSSVAKMEANAPNVSVDLLLKALFATGATREDLAEILVSAA